MQFESIHPFLDGNGRLGRLLITFLLCQAGVLREPILYLSLYLKKHRSRYYELLNRVRTDGDWETWLDFFLTGVAETADQATRTARKMRDLVDSDRRRIETIGRASANGLRLHELMQTRPIISATVAAKELAVTFPTAAAALDSLTKIGILSERTGRERHRVFAYTAYIQLLSEED